MNQYFIKDFQLKTILNLISNLALISGECYHVITALLQFEFVADTFKKLISKFVIKITKTQMLQQHVSIQTTLYSVMLSHFQENYLFFQFFFNLFALYI